MTTSTRDKLLEHAERLIRTRGYRGFSYRDLADLVGIKTASIHYHFPTKEDLALAAVRNYGERAEEALAQIDPDLPPLERLRHFETLATEASAHGRMGCLCGMLAIETACLPDAVLATLQAYYLRNEEWLTRLFAEAQQKGEIAYRGDPAVLARMAYAAYQGSLVTGRLFEDDGRIADIRRVMEQS